MSYLPRMSKTYKEPQLQDFEEPEENLLTNTLKPASSLLNEKGYNPQSILKHYRYHPHPLPVLPGPSLLEEALENERFKEANRMRRSASKMETISRASETIANGPAEEEEQQNEENIFETESVIEENLKQSQSRKGIKKSKSNLGKKKSSKLLKRENSSKVTVNMCLVKSDMPFSPNKIESNSKNAIGDFEFLKPNDNKDEKSLSTTLSSNKTTKTKKLTDLLKQDEVEVETKTLVDRSNQCAIVGSFSKEFVVPPVVNSLLQTLSFLIHEISKEIISKCSLSKEKKTLMSQSQSLLDSLCNERVDKDYSFEMTYSDFKRLEKIQGEIKKYLRDVYGDKSEYIDKMEDLKRVFIELRKKEMELFDLGEKLVEIDEAPQDIAVSEKDLKNPEVALQNNRLESEQLTAEVEFSLMELRNYQKSLAELDWDIKSLHKKVHNLKKSTSSSKTEVLRKCSRKFSSEIVSKGNRNFE